MLVDDLGQSVKLSSKLFDNPKNRKQNGMRLLRYVDRADSEQKINDRYAISLESEERQRFYKQKSKKHNMKVDLPTASAEDIQKFFE